MKKLILCLMFVLALMAGAEAYAQPQETAEETQESKEAQILKLCRWYVTTVPTDDAGQSDLRRAAAAEILKYAADTDKFSLTLTEAATQLLSSESDFLMVYIAGEVIYCLEHNLKSSDAASFANAMEGVMTLYAQMPDHKAKSLNKYLKMEPSKRMAKFEELYNK